MWFFLFSVSGNRIILVYNRLIYSVNLAEKALVSERHKLDFLDSIVPNIKTYTWPCQRSTVDF